jgi:hypothetical protein
MTAHNVSDTAQAVSTRRPPNKDFAAVRIVVAAAAESPSQFQV